MLRKLSSNSWMNSYFDRGMERVPTLKSELESVVQEFGQGHIIGSSACFLPGNQVLTKSGNKNIENITENDWILNKYGKWEKVNYPTTRDYQGKGYKILFYNDSFDSQVTCTEDHQFLVTTSNWSKTQTPFRWIRAKDLIIKSGAQKHICLCPVLETSYSNKNVYTRDEILRPFFKQNGEYNYRYQLPEKIILTPELMRLFGLFFGDGSISKKESHNQRISFSFNIEEYNNYYQMIVNPVEQQLNFVFSKQERPLNNKIELTTGNIQILALFDFFCGRNHAKEKRISNKLMHVTQELDMELFFGYLLADGYTRVRRLNSGYSSGEFTLASISKELIYGMREILESLGIKNNITETKEKVDSNGVHHQTAYYLNGASLSLGSIDKKIFYNHQDIINMFLKAQQENNKKYIVYQGQKYQKKYIKSKEEIEIKEKVYCLNVNSHSFVLNNIIVHNCLGSELDNAILEMDKAERIGNLEGKREHYNRIINFVTWCKQIFGDDYYMEVQPARSKEQLIVNRRMKSIADYFKVKIIVTTDAHYLRKEDREVHKAFLNSKQGDREVDMFYETCYLQTTEEVIENLKDTGLDYYELEANTLEIKSKIQDFGFARKQQVPQVEVKDYPKIRSSLGYKTLDYLYQSDNPQERYWVNYCIDELKNKNLYNEIYLSRLEEEAKDKRIIGEKLETCMFAYPIFLQHYIDRFWDIGSTVGAGRGSACAGLNHWLLGVTQLDPIKWELPWWRYMNPDRLELADIDIDICPSKRELIFEDIRKERGQLGCVQVCTYGTETTRSAIATACRGYRSEDFPNGIDNDIAQYMTSLAPSERGFVWPVHDLVHGNEEKNRKPVKQFINEVKKYPGLLRVIETIEGLISHRGVHASGVVFYDKDPFETSCFMKATSGAIVTQYSLHDAEYCGDVKYDFLVTEIQDVITQCLNLLQEYNEIDENLSLRQIYDKYIHPDVLPIQDNKMWDVLAEGKVLKLFQFDSQVGSQTVKTLRPHTPREMANCNSVMRLMAIEKGGETPTERYKRMKDNMYLWYDEMNRWHLTQEEQKILEKYYLSTYATPGQQEDLMMILMDPDICNFSLAEANDARKICAKKQMSRIEELYEKVLNKARSKQLGEYVWETALRIQMGYSFSLIHSLAYSFVGLQTVYLATYFDPVYWNTACLRVDAGLEEDASSNYGKIAKAVGNISHRGIPFSLVDINKSGYMFEPDIESGSILYGMKAQY